MADSDISKDKIALLMKMLYNEGGYLPLTEFAEFLNCKPNEALEWISEYPNHFKISNTDCKDDMILGITKVTFCEKHASQPGKCQGCDSLHVCKFFALADSCKFGDSCIFSHDFFKAGHNKRILRKYHLQQLNLEELRCLFQKLENRCNITIPIICKYFNRGYCKKGDDCICFHICEYYVKNNCNANCKINHDFDESNYRILKMFGISHTCVSKVLSNLRVLYNVQSNTREIDDTKPLNGNVICCYYLSFQCKFNDACRYHHNEMPYQWQYKISNNENEEWKNFNEQWNEQIESEFCKLKIKTSITDSKKSTASFQFDTMRCVIAEQEYSLYRLSTVSFKKDLSPFATNWIWYWKDDNDSWMEYGSPKANSINVTNEDIEKSYLDNPKGTITIQIDGKHEAEINFHEMIQKMNKDRDVLRRPKFISIEKASELRNKSRGAINKLNPNIQLNCFPPNWKLPANVSEIPDYYEVIEVDEISDEFKMVSDQVKATMKNAEITKIERIQNGSLWERYIWKRTTMAKETPGKKLKELDLFHGTDWKLIDVICKQGFDVRLSNKWNRPKYGEGSYFAKDAVFSHGYASPMEGEYKIFLAKVLIGEYTKGNINYTRPPQKNPNEIGGKLYDSCVDDVFNPKLFVIFSNEQIYPDYIITYNENVPKTC